MFTKKMTSFMVLIHFIILFHAGCCSQNNPEITDPSGSSTGTEIIYLDEGGNVIGNKTLILPGKFDLNYGENSIRKIPDEASQAKSAVETKKVSDSATERLDERKESVVPNESRIASTPDVTEIGRSKRVKKSPNLFPPRDWHQFARPTEVTVDNNNENEPQPPRDWHQFVKPTEVSVQNRNQDESQLPRDWHLLVKPSELTHTPRLDANEGPLESTERQPHRVDWHALIKPTVIPLHQRRPLNVEPFLTDDSHSSNKHSEVSSRLRSEIKESVSSVDWSQLAKPTEVSFSGKRRFNLRTTKQPRRLPAQIDWQQRAKPTELTIRDRGGSETTRLPRRYSSQRDWHQLAIPTDVPDRERGSSRVGTTRVPRRYSTERDWHQFVKPTETSLTSEEPIKVRKPTEEPSYSSDQSTIRTLLPKGWHLLAKPTGSAHAETSSPNIAEDTTTISPSLPEIERKLVTPIINTNVGFKISDETRSPKKEKSSLGSRKGERRFVSNTGTSQNTDSEIFNNSKNVETKSEIGNEGEPVGKDSSGGGQTSIKSVGVKTTISTSFKIAKTSNVTVVNGNGHSVTSHQNKANVSYRTDSAEQKNDQRKVNVNSTDQSSISRSVSYKSGGNNAKTSSKASISRLKNLDAFRDIPFSLKDFKLDVDKPINITSGNYTITLFSKTGAAGRVDGKTHPASESPKTIATRLQTNIKAAKSTAKSSEVNSKSQDLQEHTSVKVPNSEKMENGDNETAPSSTTEIPGEFNDSINYDQDDELNSDSGSTLRPSQTHRTTLRTSLKTRAGSISGERTTSGSRPRWPLNRRRKVNSNRRFMLRTRKPLPRRRIHRPFHPTKSSRPMSWTRKTRPPPRYTTRHSIFKKFRTIPTSPPKKVTSTTEHVYTSKPVEEGELSSNFIKSGGEIRLEDGIEWTNSLADKNSKEFKTLALDLKVILEEVFKNSIWAPVFIRVDIDGFYKGSVVVDYDVVFKRAIANRIKPVHLRHILIEALQRDGGELGTYTVNDTSIKFHAFTDLVDPKPSTPSDKVDEPAVPQWAIAVIVISVVSLIFVILFSGVAYCNKRASTQKKLGDRILDDGGDVEKPPMNGYDNVGLDAVYDMEEWRRPVKQPKNLNGKKKRDRYYDSWKTEWSGYKGPTRPAISEF